jgi:cobalt-zinc-cadmium efflux system outer membrane protein
MKTKKIGLLFLSIAVALVLTAAPFSVFCQERPGPSTPHAPLRLEDLEKMALEFNPTIAQAQDVVRSAEGRKIQAGLYPNPSLGYKGEEISTRHPGERSQNYIFLEQRIVTSSKLKHRRDVFDHLLGEAETRLEIQKIRLLSDVHVLYFQVLGAQEMLGARKQLAALAREAVEISRQLFNIGQADEPDLLASEIEAQKAELDLQAAARELERNWIILAALVGKPELARADLLGDLESEIAELSKEVLLDEIIRESPELKIVRLDIKRAKSSLQAAKADRIPDLFLGGGLGYNREAQETQAFAEVRIALPLFDRNQGTIAAAKADLERAEREVHRLELDLRSRFESLFEEYQNSSQRAERYRKEVLPRASRAYELYLAGFQKMTAAYPQVLIAQRTLFQAKTDYITALVGYRQSVVRIEGMLLSAGLESLGAALPEGGGPSPSVSISTFQNNE